MPALVAERLGDRLAERDAAILHRVVLVDMQVARHLDGEVEEAVAGEELEHMVEEADTRLDVGLSRSVEAHAHRNVRLGRAALNLTGAHREVLLGGAF